MILRDLQHISSSHPNYMLDKKTKQIMFEADWIVVTHDTEFTHSHADTAQIGLFVEILSSRVFLDLYHTRFLSRI